MGKFDQTWVLLFVFVIYFNSMPVNQIHVVQTMVIYIQFYFIKESSGDSAGDRNRDLHSSEIVPVKCPWNEAGWNGK